MRRFLLVSSSRVYGGGYLEHCEEQVRALFSAGERVLFVPYALADRDGYAASARARFAEMDLALDSVHQAEDPVAAVETAESLFIGGGNTFRLLETLYRRALLEPIRRTVDSGMPYLGTSAGSVVACATLRTTNDMPIVFPPSFEALGLVPFQINAHYIDTDPASRHQGETRDQRLAEFHEENVLPVVALREGAMLGIEGGAVQIQGPPAGKIFLRGEDPRELRQGERLDFLLDP